MYIRQLFAQKPCVFSIECFPPKQADNYPKMQESLRKMAALEPDFMSVTYGAGGSLPGSVTTCQIAGFLKNELHVEPMAHLTCMGADAEKVEQVLNELFAAGIQNILTLRGDKRPDLALSEQFPHASDLAAFIRSRYGSFGLSGACYPEGHTESDSLAEDVRTLKIKEESGISHLVSQLFFDNAKYYRFLNMARKNGISVPISAGVMPIVRKNQIERTVAMSSASLPSEFTRMIARYQDDEVSLYQAGIDYAVRQIRDLIEGGADGIHLYAMNNAGVAAQIKEGIADLL